MFVSACTFSYCRKIESWSNVFCHSDMQLDPIDTKYDILRSFTSIAITLTVATQT